MDFPKTKRRTINMAISELSEDAIVLGAVNNIAEMENLLDKPSYMLRLQGVRLRFVKEGTGSAVIRYENPPSQDARELAQLRSKKAAFYREHLRLWRRNRDAAMKRFREESSTVVPVFRYVATKRTRSVVYWSKIWLTNDELRRLDIDRYTREISSPSEALQSLIMGRRKATLQLKGAGRIVRVRLTKKVSYTAHVRTFWKNRKRLNKAKFRLLREGWFAENPYIPAGQDPYIRRLNVAIARVEARMRNEYKSCVACNTIARVSGMALKGLRDDYVDMWSVRSPHTYHYLPDHPIAPICSPWEPARIEEIERPMFSRGISARDRYSAQKLRTEPTREVLAESDIKMLEDDEYYDRDAFDRAQIALSNLDVGSDDLAQFNAFRSTAELRDMGQTSKQAKDFIRWLRSGSVPKLSTTLKAAAAAHLAWKFAVEPTMGDINTLLKNTRRHLLGCRRGLWTLLQHINLYAEGGMTIRKYVSSIPKNITTALRPYFPAEISVVRHEQHVPVYWGQCRCRSLPIIRLRMTPDGRTYRYEDYGDLRAILSWIPEEYRPRLVVLPDRELTFARFSYSELRKALDPSKVSNLIETMRLPMTVWELYPLSFVVDWFLETHKVMKNIQNTISSWISDLRPESGVWAAGRREAALVYPLYRHNDGDEIIRAQASGPVRRVVGTNPDGSEFAIIGEMEDVTYWNKAPLSEVKLIPLGIKAFNRGLKDNADYLRALIPHVKNQLGLGQITTMAEMILTMYT